MVGDEFWFSHLATRRSLRERVIAAHAAQKILVASPATEIKRLGGDAASEGDLKALHGHVRAQFGPDVGL